MAGEDYDTHYVEDAAEVAGMDPYVDWQREDDEAQAKHDADLDTLDERRGRS